MKSQILFFVIIFLVPVLAKQKLEKKPKNDEFTALAEYSKSITVVSEFGVIDYNPSMVLVWELCGVEARSEITTIFESQIGGGDRLVLSFNPSINSLIFETVSSDQKNISKKVVDLQVTEINTLFFLFNEKDKIQIYVDCPRSNRVKMFWSSETISRMREIRLFKNAHGFMNLESALSSFKCRDVISILPGTVIHFTGQLNLVGTLIFSFVISSSNQNIIYSFTFLNGQFQVISNNGQVVNIHLTQQITNGFYLYFTITGVQIFVNCPYKQPSIGSWSTREFSNKVQIETSRVHHIGNGGSDVLMLSFCTTNTLINIIDLNNTSSCIPFQQIQTSVQLIDKGNSFTSLFLPTNEQTKKIEFFDSLDRFNYAYLMSPEHRILIASRVNAQPKFFYRKMQDYIEGFSDGQSNFWIGLDTLHKVTNQYNYKLRIETQNGLFVEEYSIFRVGNQAQKYKLTVQTPVIYNANGFLNHNNMEFSAYNYGPYSNRAVQFNGGFWFPPGQIYYCQTCETSIDATGSYYNNYQFGGYFYKNNYGTYYEYTTRVFKMFLVP